jgi:hypothetical protein
MLTISEMLCSPKRRKTSIKSNQRTEIARRIRETRQDLYGENGLPILTEALNLSPRTWLNYKRGVTIPGDVLLQFLKATGTDPHWLLTGEGNRTIVRASKTHWL